MRRMMRLVWSRLRGTELVVWGLLYVVAAGVEGLGALMKGAAQDRFSATWNEGDEEEDDDDEDYRHRRR
jgi:hypothetical protein